MKMLPEHFESIKTAVLDAQKHMDEQAVNRGHGSAALSYYVGGMSWKRYRWDVFYASRWMKGDEFQPKGPSGQSGNIGAIYEYLNDDHIDTALRKIIPGDLWEAA